MTSPSIMFATDVKADSILLHGVVEVSWKNPTHPQFKEVAVYRKQNDFMTDEYDPYGQLIYQGTAERIFDFSDSKPADTDFSRVAAQVIGNYNPYNQTFSNQVKDILSNEILYYYTVFTIDNDGKYHASYATRDTGRPTKDFGIARKLYDYLPSLYKIEDRNKQLERFLQILGMAYNYIMTKNSNIRHFIDIDSCDPDQLDYIAYTLDWQLDKTLPIPSQRQSLKNAIDIYRNAGTLKGLDVLVKTNSGFPNTSGVQEGRDFTMHTVYFGFFPFDLVRFDNHITPDFREGMMDFSAIGRGGDPLKYTEDFSPNARQQTDRFIAYVRKTTEITEEQEQLVYERIDRLLRRFAPVGTRYDIDIY